MKKENIHAGHRKRMREQFLNHGLEGFTDIQALELLLFFAIPRGDTNELSHALLDSFRDFRGVMEADVGDLKRVEGVGESAAALIALTAALNRRYLSARSKPGTALRGTEDMADFIRRLFAYQNRELILMICLDGAARVLCHRVLAEGTVNSVLLPIRGVVDTALRENASGVILAHNHLADIAVPSRADVEATRRLYQTLRTLDIELVDHFVVAENDCVSMRESGFFSLW